MHQQLIRLAEQHRAEHEVHHVARDLAGWSAEHVHLLAEHAARLDLLVSDEPETPGRAADRVRAAISSMTGHRPEPGLLLLNDLREVYLQAADNSLAWEMLAQIAQVKRESQLLALTEHCHPQNLRQLRWANTMIKTQSPQILASL
jgi:hypothetical protein